MDFADAYFTDFLRTRTGTPLLQGYDTLNTEFAIHFRDTGKTWLVAVRQGMIRRVSAVPVREAPVCFELDRRVFREIVEGTITPQQAFFARRTDIQGNMRAGLRLAKVLSVFFQEHPWSQA